MADPRNELIPQRLLLHFEGKYFTGDGCRIDKDGYYWLLGRIDDVINVAAHRFATAEIEKRTRLTLQCRGGGCRRVSARN